MRFFIWCYSFLYLIQMFINIASTAAVQSTSVRYKIRKNCKIKDGSTMAESADKTLTSCIIRCRDRIDCISVAWNSITSSCQLSMYDTIFEVESTYAHYEEAEDWKCASIVRFKVFRALNSGFATNRYEMSFARAKERCAELGTTLASSSDLWEAQNQGLSYCNCAWMSDGNNALLLFSYDPVCFGSYNQGPIICWFSLADAWCLMP